MAEGVASLCVIFELGASYLSSSWHASPKGIEDASIAWWTPHYGLSFGIESRVELDWCAWVPFVEQQTLLEQGTWTVNHKLASIHKEDWICKHSMIIPTLWPIFWEHPRWYWNGVHGCPPMSTIPHCRLLLKLATIKLPHGLIYWWLITKNTW